MTQLGLTLNEAKTSLKDARHERFDFLGYSFGSHRYKANGKWYLGASPSGRPLASAEDSSASEADKRPKDAPLSQRIPLRTRRPI